MFANTYGEYHTLEPFWEGGLFSSLGQSARCYIYLLSVACWYDQGHSTLYCSVLAFLVMPRDPSCTQ